MHQGETHPDRLSGSSTAPWVPLFCVCLRPYRPKDILELTIPAIECIPYERIAMAGGLICIAKGLEIIFGSFIQTPNLLPKGHKLQRMLAVIILGKFWIKHVNIFQWHNGRVRRIRYYSFNYQIVQNLLCFAILPFGFWLFEGIIIVSICAVFFLPLFLIKKSRPNPLLLQS